MFLDPSYLTALVLTLSNSFIDGVIVLVLVPRRRFGLKMVIVVDLRVVES